MPIPFHLQELLTEAMNAVNSHPEHELNLSYRRAIYAALGPHFAPPITEETSGLQKRATLAISTVRYILSLWEQARPLDFTPHNLLSKGEQALKGEISLYQLEKEVQDFWLYMDYVVLDHQDEELNFTLAGYSTAKALAVVLRDEMFFPDSLDDDLTDEKLDPLEYDYAYDAAATYANGYKWHSESEPMKRLQFWEWWLTKAIPSAWVAVP